MSTNDYLVRFFREKLNIDVYPAQSGDEAFMDLAYKIRNIIAHNNSVLSHKDKKIIIDEIDANCDNTAPLSKEDIKLDSGIVALTPLYLEKVFSIVNHVFNTINGEICKACRAD